MNTIQITQEELINFMFENVQINIELSDKKKSQLKNFYKAVLICISGDVHPTNKNYIAIYGSLITEILNKKNNKPYNKVKDINLLVNISKATSDISESFKFCDYKKIMDLNYNNDICETGVLERIQKLLGINIYITVIKMPITEYIEKKLIFNFNKAFYMNTKIYTGNTYNNQQLISKKHMKIHAGFLLNQLTHGVRYNVCSNL